jgi:O-antigen/teichoic acid export membrane protein
LGKSIFKNKKVSPLLKNIFVYAFSDGLTKALPFLVFPIIAYYLSAEDFGRVNNFQVLISLLVPFVTLNTSSYFSVDYYKNVNNGKLVYNQILYFTFFLFIVVVIFVLLLLNKISKLIELPVFWIFIALITTFFQAYTSLFLVKLRIQEKAKVFGIFNFVSALIASSMVILLVVIFNYGWEGRIWSLFIAALCTGVISIYFGLKYIKKLRKIEFSFWKPLLLFGIPLLPHSLAIWIKSAFAKIFITDSLGLAENGVYSFAISINAIFLIFATAYFSAFSPFMYKKLSSTDNPENLYAIKKDIVKKIYIFLGFYSIVLLSGYFVLYFIINQFFLEKYGESLSYLPYLLFYNLFNAGYISLSSLVFYTKSTKYLGVLTIFTAFLNIVLLIVLIPIFGTIGAPIATLIVSVLTLVLIYFYSNKVFYMPWFSKGLFKL